MIWMKVQWEHTELFTSLLPNKMSEVICLCIVYTDDCIFAHEQNSLSCQFCGFTIMNMKSEHASLDACTQSDLLCLRVVSEIANVCAN